MKLPTSKMIEQQKMQSLQNDKCYDHIVVSQRSIILITNQVSSKSRASLSSICDSDFYAKIKNSIKKVLLPSLNLSTNYNKMLKNNGCCGVKQFLCLLIIISGHILACDCGQFPAISAYESNRGILTSLNIPPNSDINLNASSSNKEDYYHNNYHSKGEQNSRYLLLLCRATYPIQWLYTGDGLPEFETNTSISWETDPIIFMAAVSLLKLSTYHTGTYTCTSTQNPSLSQFFYLYVTGDGLFTSSSGKKITFSKYDQTVRIPCSLSNPKAHVTLQKLVDGYVNCPMNDSISYSGKKGFTLKVSDMYQPQGEYLCIASYNGTFNFLQYELVFDPSSGQSLQPSKQSSGGGGSGPNSHLKCSQFPCGQNAHCFIDSATGEPRCRCDRHFHGDNPYRKCHPECVLDIDCPSNRICNQNACEDPCPSACGPYISLVQSCKVEGHRAICSYNSCNPSPCGSFSKCEDFQTHSRCSCLPGTIGSPPHCTDLFSSSSSSSSSSKPPKGGSASIGLIPASIVSSPQNQQSNLATGGPLSPDNFPQSPQNPTATAIASAADGGGGGQMILCDTNQDCPPYLTCRQGTCENPCYPHPCGRNTNCIAKNQKAICKCLPGFIKVNQYCLPVNCRTRNDCPPNKACVRNKCINPCAGYCGANSDCTVTNHAASCKCFAGFTGNPSQGCVRIKIPLQLSTLRESTTTTQEPPEFIPKTSSPPPLSPSSPTPASSSSMSSSTPSNTFLNNRYPYPVPTPGIIQPIKGSQIPQSPFKPCGSGAGGLKCGKNAKCETTLSETTGFCQCLAGFSGDPTRFCWQIISLPDDQSEIPKDPLPVGVGGGGLNNVGGSSIEFGNILTATGTVIPVMKQPNPALQTLYKKPTLPTSSSSRPSLTDGSESNLSCAVHGDCPVDKSCVAGSCFDPCALFHPVCGDNQDCHVIDHATVCRCKPQFPVKIHNNCFRPGNYTSLGLALLSSGQLITKNKAEHQQKLQQQQQQIQQDQVPAPPTPVQPSMLKKPVLGQACVDHYECPDLLACINKTCADPCQGACGILARCRVYNKRAKCFCPNTFFGNPRIRCNSPTFNSRLIAGQQQQQQQREDGVDFEEEDFDTTEMDNQTDLPLEQQQQQQQTLSSTISSVVVLKLNNTNVNFTGIKKVGGVRHVKGQHQEEKQKERHREQVARYDDEYFDDSNEFVF